MDIPPQARESAPLPGYVRLDFSHDVYYGAVVDEKFKSLRNIIKERACISAECQYTLYRCVQHCLSIPGEFWECGVFLGGSARMVRDLAPDRVLRLFDTFQCMPEGNPDIDYHTSGDFQSTGVDDVSKFVGPAFYHIGLIPDTFTGCENCCISFIHLDLDLHDSTLEALKFIYPRVMRGGMILIDDYGRPTTMGVRKAVDDFFSDKPEFHIPNVTTGNTLVVKL